VVFEKTRKNRELEKFGDSILIKKFGDSILINVWITPDLAGISWYAAIPRSPPGRGRFARG
jgi:hypothetical protein